MSQISSIETKLRKLQQDDDRLSQVIDQLLRITKEIEDMQKAAAEAMRRINALR